MAFKLSSSEYHNWLERLNAVRATHGMGSVPGPSVPVVPYTPAKGSQVLHLRDAIYTTRNSEKHLQDAIIDIQGTFNPGDPVRAITRTGIIHALDAMEHVCHYDPCVVNSLCSNTNPCSNSNITTTGNCRTYSTSNCYTTNCNTTNCNTSSCITSSYSTCSTDITGYFSITGSNSTSGATYNTQNTLSTYNTNDTNSTMNTDGTWSTDGTCNTDSTNSTDQTNNISNQTICTNSAVNATNANFVTTV